jgi:MarR family transcriptional regulator, organic hydroperoxide resistance regulator
MAAGSLGDVLEFMRLLWAVEHGLQKRSKRMARELGLTGPQRLALRVIGRRPGISAGDLAAQLRLHPSTVTGVLFRLEGRRCIERRPHATDGRRARLFATPRGRRFNRRSTGTVESAVKQLLARVGAARLGVARGVLTELADALEARASRD